VGEHHRARLPGGERGAEGPVDHHRRVLGGEHRLHVLRGVGEQRLQVDALLVGRPQHAPLLLPDDRDERHVVELRVVQAVEQVDRARPLGGQHHPDLAGVLGVPDGHQRRVLLVPRLHESPAGPRPGAALRAGC
jgi:hypothetical protein